MRAFLGADEFYMATSRLSISSASSFAPGVAIIASGAEGFSSKSDSSGDTILTSVFCELIIAQFFQKTTEIALKIFICRYSTICDCL